MSENELGTALDVTMAEVTADLARVIFVEAGLRATIESMGVVNAGLIEDLKRSERARAESAHLLRGVRVKNRRQWRQLQDCRGRER